MKLMQLHATSRQPQQPAAGIKGVIYGREFASKPIEVDRALLEKTYLEAGQNTVLDVIIDSDDKPLKALFQDVQTHPLTNQIIHFDLHAVSLKDKVHAEVPIEVVGETQIIILNEGILTTVQDMIEVESEPLSIPEKFVVDISTLREINDNITVSDLKPPEGVTILTNPENVIVKIDAIVERADEVPEVDEEAVTEGDTTPDDVSGADDVSDEINNSDS